MRAAPALLAALLLSACAGGLLGDREAERITIGEDVFSVTVRGRNVEVRNFATGVFNQARLYRNAEAAAAAATGCEPVRTSQRPGFNIWDIRVDCG